MTPGVPTDVHLRTGKGFVALVTSIEGVTTVIVIRNAVKLTTSQPDTAQQIFWRKE